MATVPSILAELKSKGKENTRKTYARHGMAADRVFGVSVADLKFVAKTIKGRQSLACDLLSTGVMDAMYLAGMVADGSKVSEEQLSQWLENTAGLQMISEYTIPWLAVEHPRARALALAWIKSKKEHVATAGWCTYSGLVLPEIEALLQQIPQQIGSAPNRVRLTMNNFVIAVGTYVLPLLQQAKAAARKIGAVSVDMGDTACKVPLATSYIEKAEASGKLGKKRKTIRC
jgi:hypothetical protein